MRKILRSVSILLCLCLLLGVSALAAGTGRVCTVEAGDLMFTLPDGMIMLDAGQAGELLDQETLEATLDMVLSDTQYSNMNTQLLSAIASADSSDAPAFTGAMLKISGAELEGDIDFASLDEESVNIMNTLYGTLGEALADSIEGLGKLEIGMWKNTQTHYLKLHMELTAEAELYIIDEYCTFLNDECYMFMFIATQKEMQSVSETIMNSMIVGRHSFYPGGFPDLNGHWSAEFSAKAVELGLFTGVTETEFAPNNSMTRAMLVQVLYRMQGSPEAGGSTFTDVADSAWYAKAVAWASENGIVNGSNGRFDPNGLLTREQLAAILWRYAQYEGRDVSVGENTNILSYDDAQDISSYAVPSMQWACGAGLLEGSSGKLMPKSTTTRAQAATVLVRYLDEG